MKTNAYAKRLLVSGRFFTLLEQLLMGRCAVSNQYLGDDRIVHEPLDVSKASSRRIYPNSEVSDDIVTRLREKYAGQLPICIEAADEIKRLRSTLSGTRIVGDALAKYVSSEIKCTCRREWVCHRCQALDAWKSTQEK